MPYVRNRPQMARRARRSANGSYVQAGDYRGPGAIAAFDMGLGVVARVETKSAPPTRTTITKPTGSGGAPVRKVDVIPRAVTAAAAASAAGQPTAVVVGSGPQPPGCDPVSGYYLGSNGQCVQTFSPSQCPSGYTIQGQAGLPGARCVPSAATAAAAAAGGGTLASASACVAQGGSYANGVCTPPTAAQIAAKNAAACTAAGNVWANGACAPAPVAPTCQVGFVVDPTSNQCVAVQCQAGFVVDATTGKCVPIAPTPDIACAVAGGTWDAVNNICVKQTTPGGTTGASGGGGGGGGGSVNCADGYTWDPSTGQCVPVLYTPPSISPTPDGSVPDASGGGFLSTVPWWAWMLGAAAGYMLLVRKPSAPAL